MHSSELPGKVVPRYRDVLKRTWRANEHGYAKQLKGGMVLACTLSSLVIAGTNILEPSSPAVIVPGALTLLGVLAFAVLATGAILWGELAAMSLVTLGELSEGYHLGPAKPRWEQVVLCWKVLHAPEDVREVYVGITQDLKGTPRLHHLRSARFLAKG